MTLTLMVFFAHSNLNVFLHIKSKPISLTFSDYSPSRKADETIRCNRRIQCCTLNGIVAHQHKPYDKSDN